MKIIDAHIHFCDDPYFDGIALAAGHENSPRHLRQAFSDSNVVHAVVMGNRDLSMEHHQYPKFLSYCVGLDSHYFRDADRKKTEELVEKHLKRDTCVGLKLYPGYNPTPVTDPVYAPYYDLARQAGKPVAIHTGATASANALLKFSHPLALDEVAIAWPQVQFVMCHMGNPWLVDAAAVLSKNKNVAADLSGILEGRPDMDLFFEENRLYLEHLKTWIGYVGDYDRFLYGTDWPLVNIPAAIAFVSRLIPERHHGKVFYANANRIYRLGLTVEPEEGGKGIGC